MLTMLSTLFSSFVGSSAALTAAPMSAAAVALVSYASAAACDVFNVDISPSAAFSLSRLLEVVLRLVEILLSLAVHGFQRLQLGVHCRDSGYTDSSMMFDNFFFKKKIINQSLF
jgi:hypothetical protein